jgi:hypothetical protein
MTFHIQYKDNVGSWQVCWNCLGLKSAIRGSVKRQQENIKSARNQIDVIDTFIFEKSNYYDLFILILQENECLPVEGIRPLYKK